MATLRMLVHPKESPALNRRAGTITYSTKANTAGFTLRPSRFFGPPYTPYCAFPRTHRIDSAIGVFCSLACIVGVAWLGEALRSGPPVIVRKAPLPPSIEIVMPPIPPELEEVQDIAPKATETADIAPMTLPDVPSISPAGYFEVPLEIPPPPGLTVNVKALVVPPGLARAGGERIYDPSMLDQQPIPTFQPSPIYPYVMKQARISGTVVLDFVVEVDGRVTQVFAESSTHAEFTDNAVQAVSKWRFRPGRRGGRAVRTLVQIPIKFTLVDQ